MYGQIYLRILIEGMFTFIDSRLEEPLENDIPVLKTDYEIWKDKSSYKEFRTKEIPTGSELFDYIEEYIPEIKENNTPTIEERIKALELTMLEVL